MAKYKLSYYSPVGDFYENFSEFSSLEYAKADNEVGFMEIVLDDGILSTEPVLDGRLEIYRKVGANPYRLEFNTQWFIRDWSYEKIGEKNTLRIKAHCQNHLLGRPIVAYAAGTSEASKTEPADDMIKSIVDENLGSSAIADRDISTYLDISPDTSEAPSISKSFSWRRMFYVLQEISNSSANLGTYLVFDIEKLTTSQGQLNTYIGQRGTDRGIESVKPLVLSDRNGALTGSVLSFSFSGMVTHVYVGGRGEGIDRQIVEVSNSDGLLLSPLNRIEKLADYRLSEIQSTLEGEGEEELRNNRAKTIIEGIFNETKEIQYGVNFDYGDLVVVEFDDYVIDVHVSPINIKVEGGSEIVTSRLRGEFDA